MSSPFYPPSIPASGSSGLTSLYSTTLVGTSATIDTGAAGFSTAFSQLLCFGMLRTDEAVALSQALITFNNDSGANYDLQAIRGRNVTASATASAAGGIGVVCAGASEAANNFSPFLMVIPGYSGTVVHKSAIIFGGPADATVANANAEMRTTRWRNTAAITRIILTGQTASLFQIGSSFAVYGI